MIWSRAGIGFLAAAVLLAAAGPVCADPASPPPLASLQLKDGRVLHNARVMSDEGTSVVIRADEGLLKIAKTNLPAAVAEAVPERSPPSATSTDGEMVMQRFDPNQAPDGPVPEPGKPAPKAVPGAKPAPAPGAAPSVGGVYKGCTIISFQVKSFQNVQGCAQVVIRNDSDQTVLIRPNEVVCMTADGGRHVARNIVSDSFPPQVKRREFVLAGGQVDDLFTFANEPLEISSVQWAR
jgi:hypothetical protein